MTPIGKKLNLIRSFLLFKITGTESVLFDKLNLWKLRRREEREARRSPMAGERCFFSNFSWMSDTTAQKDKFIDESQFGDVVGKKLKRETDRNLITELAIKGSQENMKKYFGDLKLADMECFVTDKERHSCPACNKNRK